MNVLSKEQIEFLKSQKIDLKYLFNAQGYSKKEYKKIMKELNKSIAFNVTPCKRGGHTLRTRSGHCCQCNTATIAYQQRSEASGIVYVAGSLKGELIKIGFSKALEVRSESLNRTYYAGFKDWEILFAINSDKAGEIENLANSCLHKYALSFDYFKDNHWQDSSETYKCSYSKARSIVEEVINDFNYEVILNKNSPIHEFRNLKKIK
jgi:hypothetical protein